MGKLRRLSFNTVLIALGVAAALCMLFPALAIVAAISIIGIPIALAMALLPALFIFLVLVRILMRAMPFRFGWVVAAIAAAAIVALPAAWINRSLEHRGEALVAGDMDQFGGGPLAVGSLAMVAAPAGWARDETRCDAFCLRALLTGSVDEVLVVEREDLTTALDSQEEAVSFRMERRAECPPVKLSLRNDFPVEPQKGYRPGPGPEEMMRLRIATGTCLVQAEATLGDADAVVVAGRIRRGETPYSAGLDPFADTITADRLSLYLRASDAFEERYRWTGVEIQKLLPVLLPSYVTGYGFEVRNGFPRTTQFLNIDERHAHRPDMARFYRETLGFDLRLDTSAVEMAAATALDAALNKPGQLDAVAPDLARDFFAGIRDRRAVTPDEAALGLRILADRRFEPPSDIWSLARYSADLPAETAEAIGDVLFERLTETAPGASRQEEYRNAEIASRLGGAIAALPAAAVLSHRDDLERLAREPRLRVPAYSALTRLSEFGPETVPTLLFLIDDANGYRGRSDGNEWQHPYLAGLIGLCRLGPAGAAAIEPLFDRIDEGVVPMNASYGDLMINTLAGMGVDADAIWLRVSAAGPERKRAFFDREIRRAREKPDCTY